MDIREIARRARVSIATASRAINRVPTVHPQLVRRVWKVVDEVGYYPNRQARALVSGRSHIFGLVVSEITNPFFPEIVQTFEDLAVRNNYEILLTSTAHDPKRVESSVRRMIERRVDGIAVLTFGMEELLLEHLHVQRVPLVFVDVGPNLPRITNIRINYQNGIRQAVQHLAALKHTRIAFVTGPPQLKSALARRDAFRIAMEEIGLSLTPEHIVVGDHTLEGGIRAFDLLPTRQRPTAVVCSNDMTAIGLMRQAFDQGFTVPRDLSVVGFDDIRLSQFMTPPLTTVQMSQTELARLAFQALLDECHTDGPSQQRCEYELTTHLFIRQSTALLASHDHV